MKKRFKFSEFVNNKQQIVSEITQGTTNKVKIVLKIWMRLKNIENAVINLISKLFIELTLTIRWIQC